MRLSYSSIICGSGSALGVGGGGRGAEGAASLEDAPAASATDLDDSVVCCGKACGDSGWEVAISSKREVAASSLFAVSISKACSSSVRLCIMQASTM